MSASRVSDTLPVKMVRATLDRVERVLRPVMLTDPSGAPEQDPEASASPIEGIPGADMEDSSITRELLLPTATDEPAAARASRQAREYLERRRRLLRAALDDPR